MNDKLSLALVAAAWLMAGAGASIAQATSIGINLAANETIYSGGPAASLGAGESAGFVSQQNWNNVTGASGSASGLKDSAGTTTTAAVSWSAGTTWHAWRSTTDGNSKLMAGYLDATGGSSTVTVSSIPYSLYDVYVYVGNNNNPSPAKARVSNGTVSYYYTVSFTVNQPFPGFTLTTDTTGGIYPPANYAKFSGLTGSSVTLTTYNTQNGGGGIFGVQIVPLTTRYRTAASANWNVPATWNVSFDDGATWGAAATTPTYQDDIIQVYGYDGSFGPTMVTVTADVTADQMQIGGSANYPTFSPAKVVISPGVTLAITNGPDWLNYDLACYGWITNFGTLLLKAEATVAFQPTAIYVHNQNDGTIPRAALWAIGSGTAANPGAICLVRGSGISAPNGFGQSFAHLTIDNASGVSIGAGSPTVNGTLTLANGTFDVNGNAVAADKLAGTGTMGNTGTARTLTVGGGGGSSSFDGVISGALALTKTGAGTLTLSGANTYSGNTTVSVGTLAVSGSGALAGSPNISLATSATFNVSGVTAGSYVLTGSGPQQTLVCSSSLGAATVNASGKTLVLAAGALAGLKADGAGHTVGKISVTGNLTLNANEITVEALRAPLVAGTYRLLECSGTLANSGTFGPPKMTGFGLAAGHVASVNVVTGASGHAELQVSAQPPELFPPVCSNGQMTLDWSSGGELESAWEVTGPWTLVQPQPAPPYIVPIIPDTNQFFRVRVPAPPTQPPGQASNPSPTNGASNASLLSTLGWTAGSGAVSHDVYFGTSNPPGVQTNQTGTSFDPGILLPNTTYYWRIDENNSSGTTTGSVWSFIPTVTMQHQIIYRDTNIYAAFPDLFVLPDNRVGTTFGVLHTQNHVDVNAGTISMISSDDCRTWQTTTQPLPDKRWQTSDGGFVRARAVGWIYVPDSQLDELRAQHKTIITANSNTIAYLGGAVADTFNNGTQTWDSQPMEIPAYISGLMNYNLAASSLTTRSNVRMTAVYGGRITPAYPVLKFEVFLLRSTDDGQHWECRPMYPDGPPNNPSETTLAELDDGTLVAMIRVDPEGYLYQSKSSDGGLTWSVSVNTGIWGTPAHLLAMGNNTLLCTHGYRQPPMGIRACLSRDGANTWQTNNEIILRSDAAGNGSTVGYPMTCRLSNGKLFTIYYMALPDWPTAPFIAGTTWE